VGEFGAVSQFLSANPPVAIATGALTTAALLAGFLRLFRNEVRSAAIDKAAEGVLKAVQEDNKQLRELARDVRTEADRHIREANTDRDKARRELLECQLEYGGKIATLNASVNTLYDDRQRLAAELATLNDKLKESETERLKQQMQLSGQLKTIEDLAEKVRGLEKGAAGRRRATD
jgi:putative chitinase